MRPRLFIAVVGLSILFCSSCKESIPEIIDLTALANAVPNSGPREGNHYKVFLKVLRHSSFPATGFKVEAWVRGKGRPKIKKTDRNGIVKFENLPFPTNEERLNIIFHYYKGNKDQSRAIEYPYVETDAYRITDVQYIPNDVTPKPE